MKITEHNLLTGEKTERDQTAAEIAQLAIDKAEAQAAIKTQTDKVAARQAVLDRLGITADEARMLLQ